MAAYATLDVVHQDQLRDKSALKVSKELSSDASADFIKVRALADCLRARALWPRRSPELSG
jgi:hypothetical protein